MGVIRSQCGIVRLNRVAAVWVLAILSFAVPGRAQRSAAATGSPTGEPRLQPGAQPDSDSGVFFPTEDSLPKPVVVEDESCLPWDLPDARGATVSAIRLGVPSKARGLYQKACGAFKKKKLTEAEQHARDAIQGYAKYLAAWVMLGQVLQDEQKMDEAHDACSQAVTLDPTYLPPYLCLAGLLQRENEWTELVAWSDRFLGMSLVGDRYSYYYRGLALFHLQNFPEAQKNVLRAIANDTEHHQPNLYFLLAQIYGEHGDVPEATREVQQFLKLTHDREDKDAAKHYLEKLQSQQSSK